MPSIHGHHFLVPEGIQNPEVDDVTCMEDQFGVVNVLPDDIQEPLVGPLRCVSEMTPIFNPDPSRNDWDYIARG